MADHDPNRTPAPVGTTIIWELFRGDPPEVVLMRTGLVISHATSDGEKPDTFNRHMVCKEEDTGTIFYVPASSPDWNPTYPKEV